MIETDFTAPMQGWHDFYVLIGTASATLIGLMFVAVSIAASTFTEEQRAGVQAFFTPTIAHFSAVLVVCLIVLAPVSRWTWLGALLLGSGIIGLGYAGKVWRQMGRRGLTQRIDLEDRLLYVLGPFCGQALIALSGALMLLQAAASAYLLAVALVLLLLVGIRNAWDITVWSALRAPNK